MATATSICSSTMSAASSSHRRRDRATSVSCGGSPSARAASRSRSVISGWRRTDRHTARRGSLTGRRGNRWNGHCEGRADTDGAFAGDLAVVRLDDLLGDRETETGSLRRGFLLIVRLIEAPEEMRDLLGTDACAGIAHLEAHG